MEGPLEWKYTSPAEVRRIFNDGGFWEKVQRGELTERVIRDRVPNPPPKHEPRGTRSQYIAYLDADGDEVARVHQYVRPDGVPGSSGRPDPKMVIAAGVAYYCEMDY
jgi:hypothetical protein